jgi:hypothetical protein
MKIWLCGPEGDLKAESIVRGFIGRARSPITYDLRPDRGRRLGGVRIDHVERSEWITNTEGLLDSVGAEWPARSWRICGHQVRRKVGVGIVMVDGLFR